MAVVLLLVLQRKNLLVLGTGAVKKKLLALGAGTVHKKILLVLGAAQGKEPAPSPKRKYPCTEVFFLQRQGFRAATKKTVEAWG